MPRLVYYVAQSLDGFIADPEHGVGFLDDFDTEEGDDAGYGDFYSGIDSVVMGRLTYDVVLRLGDWTYAGKPAWVMTSTTGLASDRDDVRFTDRSPSAVLEEIRAAGHSDTWLVGGAKLAASFENAGLIDEWIVSIVPHVLGSGIPLIGPAVKPTTLAFVRHQVFPTGLVQLVYRRSGS